MKVVQRLCSEHEGCQLASTDDGPWEHVQATEAARLRGLRAQETYANRVAAEIADEVVERLERRPSQALELAERRTSDRLSEMARTLSESVEREVAARLRADRLTIEDARAEIADLVAKSKEVTSEGAQQIRRIEARAAYVEQLALAAKNRVEKMSESGLGPRLEQLAKQLETETQDRLDDSARVQRQFRTVMAGLEEGNVARGSA